jgi:alkylation response protein AidB-like acyl-CoA dehydrogenase
MAHRLSKLPIIDQELVAHAIANGDLDSDDARAIIALKKCAPTLPIRDIIARIQQTRSAKHFLILFMWPRFPLTETALTKRFASILGQDGVIAIHNVSGMGVLAISESGKVHLHHTAKRYGLTRKALIDSILAGELRQYVG